MAKYVQLREFKRDELIFNEEETVKILKFIFSKRHSLIDRLTVSDRIRGFAQGLLLEAVDASYALGFVEALFLATANPGGGVKRVLKKFGQKALRHWFKHARAEDLMRITIYERVRMQLEFSFGRILTMHSNGTAMNEGNPAEFVYYGLTSNNKRW